MKDIKSNQFEYKYYSINAFAHIRAGNVETACLCFLLFFREAGRLNVSGFGQSENSPTDESN